MYIGLEHIQPLFDTHLNILKMSKSSHCLYGWIELENAPPPYSLHLLYVCKYNGEWKDSEYIEGMNILCFAGENYNLENLAEEFPPDINVLLVGCEDSNTIFSSLISFFENRCATGLFAETLLGILFYDGGVQAMIDHAYNAFNNPLFVFDAGFNLIAANWDEALRLNHALDLIESKGFTDEAFRIANTRDHIHERVQKSEVPIMAFNPDLGCDQLLSTISTKKDVGHIVISAVNHPFGPSDIDLLQILCRSIDQQLKKDEFIRNTKGFNYEYFLKDLLDGKMVTGKQFKNRLDYVKNEISGNMQCIVVETARSSGTLNTYHVRNLFESRFPDTKSLMYNGQIVIILNTSDRQSLYQKELSDAIKICRENDLYAGLSNSFYDILYFYEYYKQALRAIELGIGESNTPNLFLYEDYYIDHVKNIFVQKESSKTFCHPRMKTLLEYDKKHGSELAYTLYMYLVHERNTLSASEAMHMHRNSVAYRINKIGALIGENFENHKERQYLILSYEMNCDQLSIKRS